MICERCGKDVIPYVALGIWSPVEHDCPGLPINVLKRRVAELEALLNRTTTREDDLSALDDEAISLVEGCPPEERGGNAFTVELGNALRRAYRLGWVAGVASENESEEPSGGSNG
jgi:hypothetical protein